MAENPMLWKIIQNVEAMLAVPNGSDPYSNDLTGTDRIHMSIPEWPPPKVPCVIVADAGVDSEYGPALTETTRIATFDCVAHVEASTAAPLARLLAAARLGNDICRAVKIHRRQDDANVMPYAFGGGGSGIVDDTRVIGLKVRAAQDEVTPSFGWVQFQIEVRYRDEGGL